MQVYSTASITLHAKAVGCSLFHLYFLLMCYIFFLTFIVYLCLTEPFLSEKSASKKMRISLKLDCNMNIIKWRILLIILQPFLQQFSHSWFSILEGLGSFLFNEAAIFVPPLIMFAWNIFAEKLPLTQFCIVLILCITLYILHSNTTETMLALRHTDHLRCLCNIGRC